MANTDAENVLGQFLRARRERVRPEDVGLQATGRRRVAGLRREELAALAGISIDYYVRLERGRDRHPSSVVVGALARVLQLDAAGTAHLHELAQPAAFDAAPKRQAEEVRPAVARLIDTWTDQPAFVLGRHLQVLRANALAETLNPGFTGGTNLVRYVFLDPRARERYADWRSIAIDAVATLRGAAGPDLDDPALTELVGELSLKSDEFRRMWARHDVQEKTTGRKRYLHPHVGLLTLDFESFAVSGSPGQVLIVYSAPPGSDDERALKLLATIDTSPEHPAPVPRSSEHHDH